MSATAYNFQKPGPLASALDQQFAGWLRTMCSLLTRKWAKQLPAGLTISFQLCATYRAADMLADLADGEMGYPVSLQDKLKTLMAWPRALALALVGAILCETATEMPADRELTPVEESLFEYFLKDLFLPTFQETWPGPKLIKPEIAAREPHPRWTRMFAPDEGVVCAVFLVKGPFGEQEFRWILPKQELLAGLGHGSSEKHDAVATDGSAHLQGLVRELPVEISVSLGTVELNLAQLAQLCPGDVIVLDQRITQPLVAEIAGEKKLRGWAGRMGAQQAFQIEALDK